MLLLLLGAAYIAFVVFRGSPISRTGNQHPAVGRALFFVSLRGIADDQAVNLSDLTGEVTLINLWGTWCPPCREELPRLEVLAQKYASRDDFRIVAISCPEASDIDAATLTADTRRYLDEIGLTLPAFRDVDGQTQAAIDLVVGLAGYPTTIILDRHNMIRGVWSGYQRGDEQQMHELIERLLAEPYQVNVPEITITGNEYLVPIEDDESPP